jgi:hypothetical protein
MDNPFLALFEEGRPIKSPSPAKPKSPKKTDLTTGASRLQKINQIIENVFLFTINPYGLLGRTPNDHVKSLIFLHVKHVFI